MAYDNVSRIKPLTISSFTNIVRERQRMWGAKRRAYFQTWETADDFVYSLFDKGAWVHTVSTPDQKGWVVFYN